jgi:hypothetical protein
LAKSLFHQTIRGKKSFLSGDFWQKVFSPRRFVARSRFFQAIRGTTSVFQRHCW